MLNILKIYVRLFKNDSNLLYLDKYINMIFVMFHFDGWILFYLICLFVYTWKIINFLYFKQ